MRVIIFSFSFHRDCASKVMRKDWQAQEAARFARSSVNSISRMKLDQEMKKCIAKALAKPKPKGQHLCPVALKVLRK